MLGKHSTNGLCSGPKNGCLIPSGPLAYSPGEHIDPGGQKPCGPETLSFPLVLSKLLISCLTMESCPQITVNVILSGTGHNIEEPGGTEHSPDPEVNHGIDSQPVDFNPFGIKQPFHTQDCWKTQIFTI